MQTTARCTYALPIARSASVRRRARAQIVTPAKAQTISDTQSSAKNSHVFPSTGPARAASALIACNASRATSATTAAINAPRDLASVIEECEKSVVRIEVQVSPNGPASEVLGSGFVVDASGIIATNNHVLGDAISARVVFPNGKAAKVVGTLAMDSGRDICIAKLDAAHGFSRRMATWWSEGFDLLLTPTTAEPPPPLGSFVATRAEPFKGFIRAAPFGSFTAPFNLTGQPAISLPVHWTATGLPVGAQLVAAYGCEDVLLRVAAELEQALPWKNRRPAPL